MRSCQCWKTYTCLLCEDIATGRVVINEEGEVKRVVQVSTPRTYTPRVVAQCGTRAGYNKHRREKTATCAECRQAQSNYVNEIQNTQSINDLLKLVVDYQTTWNIGSPFYFSVYSDFDDANMNILHIFTVFYIFYIIIQKIKSIKI